MSEKRPATHYLRLRNKETDEKIYIGSGWEAKFGHSISFDRPRTYNGKTFVGIEAIKMSDGKIIKPGDWYVDFNSKPGADVSPRPSQNDAPVDDPFGSDDQDSIPF